MSRRRDTYCLFTEVTTSYLGPSTDKFISKQLELHLNKSPKSMTRRDLFKLIVWIKPLVALLNDDYKINDEYINELRKIATPKAY